MDVSDAKRLKALEDENAKLKKLLAEAMLDNAVLKDINSQKVVTPAAQRQAVAHVCAGARGERAAGVLDASVSIARRCAIAAVVPDDAAVRHAHWSSSRPSGGGSATGACICCWNARGHAA